jgi:DNA-binding response OmpR family regulator
VIRARPGIATLFISGYPDDRLMVTDSEVSPPFLQKPFETETLLVRVRELLRERAER